MKRTVSLIALAAAFVLANCVIAPPVSAGGRALRGPAFKPAGGSRRVGAPRHSGSFSGRIGPATGLGGSSTRIDMPGRPASVQDFRSSGLSGRSVRNGTQQGRLSLPEALLGGMPSLGQGYGNLADYLLTERHRDRHDPYADAYRDVGIANAVVSLVGVLLNSAQTVPQPVASGRYETQKVVVCEAHYEQEQVWIPPLYDVHTGRQIGGGYYETRTQLVPEVAEYRQVRVVE